MDSGKRLEMYKDSYKFQFDRREKLISNTTIPLGVITLLIGVAAYLIKISELPKGIAGIVFGISFIVLISGIVITIVFLVRSYYGYAYEHMPTSQESENYWKQLNKYRDDYPATAIIPDERFEEYLIEFYCKCNHANTFVNDTRSYYLHLSGRFLIVSVIAAMVALTPVHFEHGKQIFKSAFCWSREEVNKDERAKPESIPTTTTSSTNTTTHKGNQGGQQAKN